MRDGQTSMGLLEGIVDQVEPASLSVEYDAGLFSTIKAHYGKAPCVADMPNTTQQTAELNHLLDTTPMPMDVGLPNEAGWQQRFDAVLVELQKIIGSGRAWEHAFESLRKPPRIVGNKLSGSPQVIKFFSQQFMYSWASSITYMSNLSKDQMMNWNSWEYYSRHVGYAPSLLAVKGALLAKRVLLDLD